MDHETENLLAEFLGDHPDVDLPDDMDVLDSAWDEFDLEELA